MGLCVNQDSGEVWIGSMVLSRRSAQLTVDNFTFEKSGKFQIFRSEHK